jgi:hypothetical protein
MRREKAWLEPFVPLEDLPGLAGIFEFSAEENAALQRLRNWSYGGRRRRYAKSRRRLIEVVDPLRYSVMQFRNEVARALFISSFSDTSIVAFRTHVTSPSFLVGGRRVRATYPLVALRSDYSVAAHVVDDYVKEQAGHSAIAEALNWTLVEHKVIDLQRSKRTLNLISEDIRLLTIHLDNRPAEAVRDVLSFLR